ncbi:MAG: substrate-binding domain-containing protein [Gammaproteobacteria bacterium]|nr:substrate-binding domain-containing protein [Gammaproteobacteria bacterium]
MSAKTLEMHGAGATWFRHPQRSTASAAEGDGLPTDDPEAMSGTVTVAVTEGLGRFWLTAQLDTLREAFPQIDVRLDCSMSLADVRHMPSGVAVQIADVSDPELRRIKLARIHTMPFAAQRYVEALGIPQALNDVSGHRLVLQMAEQTATRELFSMVMADVPTSDVVVVRSGGSSSHYRMIADGEGIGFLPTYLFAVGEPLVPIDMNLHFPFDVWLVCGADATRIPRVQRTIDWLIQSFDPLRFPWFRDHFIHPRELLSEYNGPPIPRLAS